MSYNNPAPSQSKYIIVCYTQQYASVYSAATETDSLVIKSRVGDEDAYM